jgi:hypothetical protein
MVAAHYRQVVGQPGTYRSEQRLRIVAGVEPEAAGDRHRHVSREGSCRCLRRCRAGRRTASGSCPPSPCSPRRARVDDRRAEHRRSPSVNECDHVADAREIGLEQVIRAAGIAGRLVICVAM